MPTPRPHHALALALVLACAPAAGDDDATGTTSDAGETGATAPTTGLPDSDGAPGDPSILAGTFQLQVDRGKGQAAILGKVYDGASPAPLIWEETSVVGDCTLETPRVPFCGTPCGGSAVCVEDDTCQPYPTAHTVGDVTVRGLKIDEGGDEFVMQPIANNYQIPVGVQLDFPPFAEGDEFTFEAAGGDYFPFTLTAHGIRVLELGGGALELVDGAPLDVTWTPGDADLAEVHVKLDISHHGGTRGMIVCATADTGALAIDGGLIGELLALGVAGYPTIVVTRRTVGATTIEPGRVELVVSSSVEAAVAIPGLTSCTSDADCPDGETCQPDLTCK